MRRVFCLLLISSVATFAAMAQSGFSYFDVIQDDSVRFYVDAKHMFSSEVTRLTGRECAKGYRLTRVSKTGAYDGKFKDYFSNRTYSTLMAEGAYKEGKKEGPFKWYHPDGKVMCEGTYVDDLPSGYWKVYSANGMVILGLQFESNRDPLIDYMFDVKSNLVQVKDGNGEARFVSQLSEVPYSVSGRVKGGHPEGEWVGDAEIIFAGSMQTKKSIRRETYRDGVMVAGKKFQSGRTTDVCCTPELPLVFPLPSIVDILELESLPIEPCPGHVSIPSADPTPVQRSAEPTSDIRIFASSIKAAIRAKYQGLQVGEAYNTNIPGIEENRMVIHFNTDDDGHPVKIKLISSYGREFFPPIMRALQSQTTWHRNQEKLVLTVYIRMAVNTYSYRYNFSLD